MTPDTKYILIVEDTDKDGIILAGYLDKKGITHKLVKNSVEAMQTAQETTPALIIMDVMLPGMNGLKLTQLFKTDEVLKDVPVVVLSVIDNPANKEIAKRIGVNEYLSKPFTTAKFEVVLKKYF